MERGREVARLVVDLLNEALALDPVAVSALCCSRVPCNQKMAEHPSIQAALWVPGKYEVGMLGILNGVCGADADGLGAVAAEYPDGVDLDDYGTDNPPNVLRFVVLDRDIG